MTELSSPVAFNEHKRPYISVVNDQQESDVIQHEYSLDEAVAAIKVGKYQVLLMILTGLSLAAVIADSLAMSSVLPYVKCDMNLTISEQGALNSFSFLGNVIASYVWGFLADTWGRQKIISAAGIGGFIFTFLSAFATNTSLLIFLRFLAGAMMAGVQSGAFGYISEFHSLKSVPRAVSFASLSMYVFCLIGPILCMIIIPMDWIWTLRMFGVRVDFKPWRLFLLCVSLYNLLIGIIFSVLPESPKFLMIINQKEKALQVLKRVYAFNTGQPEDKYPIEKIKVDEIGNPLSNAKGLCDVIRLLWLQTKPIFQPPLLTSTWKVCYVEFIIFGIAHGTSTWFISFLVQLENYKGSPNSICGIIRPSNNTIEFDDGCQNLDNKNIFSYEVTIGLTVWNTFLLLLLGLLIKRFSPKVIMSVWFLVAIVACFSLNVLTEFNSIVISFVLFLSCSTCSVVAMAVAANLYPTNVRGMATSFMQLLGRIGSFVHSNLIGMLLAHSCHLNGALAISCVIIFLTIKIKDH